MQSLDLPRRLTVESRGSDGSSQGPLPAQPAPVRHVCRGLRGGARRGRRARRLREHDDADRRRTRAATGEAAKLVVPKPTGPGGLPLPRPDNAVTWAITDDEQADRGRPAGRARAAAGLQLRRLHRPGARSSGSRSSIDIKVQIATYNSLRRGDREARVRRRRLRRDHRPLRLEHRRPDRPEAAAAAQPLVPAEPREEHLAASCRTRSTTAARATRCRTSSGATASAGATTRSRRTSPAMDVPWDIFWQSQAYRGQVGILDDKRDALSMPMQRDAMRTGVAPGSEHRGPGDRSRRPSSELAELGTICNLKVAITDYQTLPEAKTVLHQSWSGDLLGAAFYYLPKGVKADVLSFWGPRAERRRPERLPLHRPHGQEPGARPPVPQLHARREERLRRTSSTSSATRRRRTRSTPRR